MTALQNSVPRRKKTASKMPTSEQIVLLYLRRPGWVVKTGAAVWRHHNGDLRVSREERKDFNPYRAPILSATQKGDMILIIAKDLDMDGEPYPVEYLVPFRVKSVDRMRIELIETHKDDHGNKSERHSLTLEHVQRKRESKNK